MIKKILAIVAGYAIFAASAVLLFRITGHEPNANPTTKFVIFAAIYGVIFSFIGGFILQMIARTKDLKINYILAIVIAGFALFSLLITEGNHWTQVLAIILFAPVSAVGGLFHIKHKQK